jgi:hypothetical protein
MVKKRILLLWNGYWRIRGSVKPHTLPDTLPANTDKKARTFLKHTNIQVFFFYFSRLKSGFFTKKRFFASLEKSNLECKGHATKVRKKRGEEMRFFIRNHALVSERLLLFLSVFIRGIISENLRVSSPSLREDNANPDHGYSHDANNKWYEGKSRIRSVRCDSLGNIRKGRNV